MKTFTVVCLFVMVSCLCFQANGLGLRVPESNGTFLPCKENLPDDIIKGCLRYSCRHNGESIMAVGCAPSFIECPEGQIKVYVPEDRTKMYPDCCADSHCEPV